MTSKRQPVSDMKKAELQQELDGWDVIYSSSDTVPELRSAVNQVRKDHLCKVPTEQDTTKGLSGMKRDDLIKKCRELEIPMGSNITNGTMIKLIKQHIALNSTPNGSDVYNIGRHQGMTYRQVRTSYSQYCDWVRKEVEESGDSCHWELQRFSRYLSRPLSPEPVPMTPTVKKERVTEMTLKVEVNELKQQIKDLDQRLRQTNKRGTSSTDSMGVDQTNDTNEEVANVLRAIMQRLENLELREMSRSDTSTWSEVKVQKD